MVGLHTLVIREPSSGLCLCLIWPRIMNNTNIQRFNGSLAWE